MDKPYSVYIHIFPDDKKYIGITKQKVECRWQNGKGYKKQPVYAAIKKYGWDNIIHEVYRDNLSLKEAQDLEQELIEHYDSIDNGYNAATGGSAGSNSYALFKYNGVIYTAEEIAEKSLNEITAHDITTRVNCRKWSIEKAMFTPKNRKKSTFFI